MLDSSPTDEMEILEAAIAGVHSARLNHRILSTFTTRTDSVLLARAALAALRGAGFKIIKDCSG